MISIYVWQFLYQCHHWHLPFYRNISDYNGLSFTHIFDTQFCLCKVSSSFSLFLSSLPLQIIFSINLNFDLSLLLCFISTHLGRENERERGRKRESHLGFFSSTSHFLLKLFSGKLLHQEGRATKTKNIFCLRCKKFELSSPIFASTNLRRSLFNNFQNFATSAQSIWGRATYVQLGVKFDYKEKIR